MVPKSNRNSRSQNEIIIPQNQCSQCAQALCCLGRLLGHRTTLLNYIILLKDISSHNIHLVFYLACRSKDSFLFQNPKLWGHALIMEHSQGLNTEHLK